MAAHFCASAATSLAVALVALVALAHATNKKGCATGEVGDVGTNFLYTKNATHQIPWGLEYFEADVPRCVEKEKVLGPKLLGARFEVCGKTSPTVTFNLNKVKVHRDSRLNFPASLTVTAYCGVRVFPPRY